MMTVTSKREEEDGGEDDKNERNHFISLFKMTLFLFLLSLSMTRRMDFVEKMMR
jgi:hypothetical protein